MMEGFNMVGSRLGMGDQSTVVWDHFGLHIDLDRLFPCLVPTAVLYHDRFCIMPLLAWDGIGAWDLGMGLH